MLSFLLSSTFLQWWGGGFYILNKIFFACKERAADVWNRRFHISAWLVYLIGLPAWLLVFGFNSNWIAVGVEAGGSLSMMLGLVNAWRGKKDITETPKWLDYAARTAVAIGIAISVYDFGGITVINQWLELGLATGFLFGTYLLAQEEPNPNGYLFFLLMLGANAWLQHIQHYPWLMVQQIASIPFVIDAYVTERWGWKYAGSKLLSYIFRTT